MTNTIPLLRDKKKLTATYMVDIFTNQWVCDFETVTNKTQYFKKFKKTRITYGYIENLQYDQQNYEFVNIYDLFDFFKQNCSHNQIVYFHYLGFDGTFILDWLGSKGGRARADHLFHEFDFSIFRTTGKKIYKINVLIKNKFRKKLIITFLCSKELLQAGVKQLGQSIGIDKFKKGQENDKDFYHVEPLNDLHSFKLKNKEYCEYCIRDVQIVKKCLVPFKIELFELMKERGYELEFESVNKCMTTAGISLALQKLELIKQGYSENDIYINEYAERAIMDQFTNGGMVILNEKYRAKSLRNVKGYMIDIKSAYPSVMRQKVPLGKMILEKPKDYDPNNYACFQVVHYNHIWSKNNHTVPLLKNWNQKKYGKGLYLTQAKDYTTYLLDQEIELIEQLYEYKNKTVVHEYYYKLADPFTDLIDYFFKMKEKYKKVNPAKSYLYKILLNAGYGVHAKRFDFLTVFPERKDNIYQDFKYSYKVKENINLNKQDRVTFVPNNKFVATENMDKFQLFEYAHKAMGNYITAKTHCILLKAIIAIGVDHFLYTDTDSIQMFGVEKEKVLSLCGTNIGEWELETWFDDQGNEYDHFTDVRVNRSKQYILENNKKVIKKRIAGVSRAEDLDITLLEKYGLNLTFKDAYLRTVRVKGGLILVEQDKIINIDDNYYESGVWVNGCSFIK